MRCNLEEGDGNTAWDTDLGIEGECMNIHVHDKGKYMVSSSE